MRKINVLMLLFVLVLFMFYWIKHGVSMEDRQNADKHSGSVNLSLVGQYTDKRSWRGVEVDTVSIIGDEGDHILYRPLVVKGGRDAVYIVDYGDMSLKKFNVAGKFITKYGGRGEGPGEFINPTDVAIGENDLVWVADGGSRSLNWFTNAGDFIRKLTFEEGILRVAPIKGGRYYLMRISPVKSEIFFLYSDKDDLVGNFGNIIENYETAAISLDGEILTVKEDLVYVPMYYGFIVRYKQDGILVFARETLESGEAPNVETMTVGGSKVQRIAGRKVLYLSPSYSDGKLYLYAGSRSKERGVTVMDVYDADKGDYLYSFKLPGFSRSVSVAGDYIYTLQDTTAVVYRVREVD
jgi:outer membrane protein assembly factor BamB